jgi:hypothetical protein
MLTPDELRAPARGLNYRPQVSKQLLWCQTLKFSALRNLSGINDLRIKVFRQCAQGKANKCVAR